MSRKEVTDKLIFTEHSEDKRSKGNQPINYLRNVVMVEKRKKSMVNVI